MTFCWQIIKITVNMSMHNVYQNYRAWWHAGLNNSVMGAIGDRTRALGCTTMITLASNLKSSSPNLKSKIATKKKLAWSSDGIRCEKVLSLVATLAPLVPPSGVMIIISKFGSIFHGELATTVRGSTNSKGRTIRYSRFRKLGKFSLKKLRIFMILGWICLL